MATKKQIDANRRNAKKSTGPRTPEGKRRVSQNAIKHGLCASQVVIPGEDEAEFERLRDGFVETLEPRDEVELALVRQMVTAEWRLRRIDRVESATIKHLLRQRKDIESCRKPEDRTPGDDGDLAKVVIYADAVQGDALSKYARYSNACNRQFHRAYKLLKERPVEPEPEGPGPDKTETDNTKPVSENSYENQRDTAFFTKPNGPHAPPDPQPNPGHQPPETRPSPSSHAKHPIDP
ncbi:MAG: hypothetical protein GY953_09165 [bacterium]|nr:hypothetical protein [bacterium]